MKETRTTINVLSISYGKTSKVIKMPRGDARPTSKPVKAPAKKKTAKKSKAKKSEKNAGTK